MKEGGQGGRVKSWSKWRHPWGEACVYGADEHSQVNKHLLVGPEVDLRA